MQVVPAEAIDRALAEPGLVDALAEAFRGGVAAPTRHHHAVPRGEGNATLLLMPAWQEAEAGFLGVKVVSVFPRNGALGLPSVMGTYLLMDGATGRPVAALDGTRLTLWRTAAASALAARHLARSDAARMVMVGAGALAPFLIRAHRAERPIRSVGIWARRPEAARALAEGLAADGIPVEPVEDLEAAVREADLVSCATLSKAPLVAGDWLRPGAHLDLVGAFDLTMREADDAALRRAEIYVDTPAARAEGGDVALGLASGAIDEAAIRGDLAGLCRGEAPGRSGPEAVTLFKSVGAALEDLVAATLAWRRLAGEGASAAP
jgi:ornithine cyclodeaminase/alanine dehydrogenase-like protein (mu-crystallin family)